MVPVQTQLSATFTGVDVVNTSTVYAAVMSKDMQVVGTGSSIIFAIATNSPDSKELSKYDPSLLGYWDMESTVMSGSQVLLKDLSRYGNHGVCLSA